MFYLIKMLEDKDIFKKDQTYVAKFFDNYFNNMLMIAIQHGYTESGLPIYKSFYVDEVKFEEIKSFM